MLLVAAAGAEHGFFVRARSPWAQRTARARLAPPRPPHPRRAASPNPPTPPPARPWQTPADIGSSHALEDGLGALPELTGRRTDPSPPARAPALALSRAQRPAGGTPGPAAHCSGCPICPQPTCPTPSPAHLIGCRLAAGGPDRRRGSETPLAGLGGPGSLCGASLLVPLGCLPRQQRFSCLFQPFLCRLQPFQLRPAGLGDGLGRPGVADVEWVGLGGSGRCCLGREASAISVDRWGKPQNWPPAVARYATGHSSTTSKANDAIRPANQVFLGHTRPLL